MENRSLLRTLWHLIYRPGYMIRDYIKGRRVPYYSPFSMLFLVATAYMMIHHFVVVDAEGVSGDIEDTHISKEEFLNVTDTASRQKAETFLDGINHFLDSLEGVIVFFDENSAFEAIFVHSIFAFITFLVFRRSSAWPRITLSESFLAQIFIASQMLLLSSLCVIATGVDDYEYSIYSMPLPLLVAVLCYDYKQLFGFSILSTVLKTAAVLLAWAISVVLIIVVTMILTVLFSFFH